MEIWVPCLQDAFNKEKENNSEHSKLYSSETVHLILYILLI